MEFLFGKTIDLNQAIEKHSHPEMFGYASVYAEDLKGVYCSIRVRGKNIDLHQAYEPDGSIDYQLILTKALILYDT